MILTIIWIGLVLLIIILWLLSKISVTIDNSMVVATTVILSLITVGAMAFIGFFCLLEAHTGLDRTYNKWNKEYRGLEARIELWNGGTEDETLWEDVKHFNSKLENAQYWANCKWTNWYNEQECNKFDTFEIPSYERGK